jgi:hypothetical protein
MTITQSQLYNKKVKAVKLALRQFGRNKTAEQLLAANLDDLARFIVDKVFNKV